MIDFEFDLQRFKGDTTVENTYTPSEHELEMQKITADYARDVAPNARHLNTFARDMLNLAEPALRNAQPMYDALNATAQQRQNSALNQLDEPRKFSFRIPTTKNLFTIEITIKRTIAPTISCGQRTRKIFATLTRQGF